MKFAKLSILFLVVITIVFLAGCSSQKLPENVVIVGEDNNSITGNAVGQIDSDTVDSTIGNDTKLINYSTVIVSMYGLNLSAFKQIDSYDYGNFKFLRDESGLWVTQFIDSSLKTLFIVVFNYDPLSVQNISLKGNLTDFYKKIAGHNASAVVTFDPMDNSTVLTAGYLELSAALGGVGVKLSPAIYKEIENATLPIVDCDGNVPVIKLVNGGKASVVYDDACLTISGTENDLVRAIDRFTWNFYGVMN